MKIKRFFAADIRQAMRMVKEELGADAVIMSNRSVDGGVEIVAARDFDEQVIQKNLQQPAESAPAQQGNKKLELPAFDADKKPVHLVSSPRKRNADGSVTEPRRGLDQYVGYAEKVAIASVNSGKLAEKVKLAERSAVAEAKPQRAAPAVAQPIRTAQSSGAAAALSARMATAAPVKSPADAAAPAERLVEEMRKEMQALRTLLDQKLAGLRLAPTPQQPVRLDLLKQLAALGLSKKLTVKLANRLGSHRDSVTAFAKAQEMLAELLPIADEPLLEFGGIAALVGPTGVGKTTTIAKLAAQYILKHGSRQVALITTDNYRIGAHEQINTYGRILDIPVGVAASAEELREHIDRFADRRLILIDTAGMSQRDLRLAEQLKTLQQGDLVIRSYLVMSAATQYKTMLDTMVAFGIAEPQACILTKWDEAVGKGAALSAIIERQLPLSFVTDGQQVPEDIFLPSGAELVRQCVADAEADSDEDGDLSYDDQLTEHYA